MFGLRAIYLFNLLYFTNGRLEVEEVISDNFYPTLAKNDLTLVLYFLPDCIPCNIFMPKFIEVAEILESESVDIALCKVDCTGENGNIASLCRTNAVVTYPRLDIFAREKLVQEYTGIQEAPHIAHFLLEIFGLNAKEIFSREELLAFVNSTRKPSVVGFFHKNGTMKKAYFKLSSLKQQFNFGFSKSLDMMKHMKVKNAIVLYRPPYLATTYEEQFLIYKERPDAAAITQFLKRHYLGLVGIRTALNKKDFRYPLVVVYYNVDFDNDPVNTRHLRNQVLSVAKQYKGKLHFAISDKHEFLIELQNMGLDLHKDEFRVPLTEAAVRDKPIVVVRDAHNRKYFMKGQPLEYLADFVQKFLNHELDSHTKSLPIPTTDPPGPVKVAVALNFDDVVIKNHKDILIIFYAPFSDKSKLSNKLFKSAAEVFRHENGVSFVQMDAFANQIRSSFNLTELPVIYWLPKNHKTSPVRYDDKFEIQSLVKFVARHATDKLAGIDRHGHVITPKKVEL